MLYSRDHVLKHAYILCELQPKTTIPSQTCILLSTLMLYILRYDANQARVYYQESVVMDVAQSNGFLITYMALPEIHKCLTNKVKLYCINSSFLQIHNAS